MKDRDSLGEDLDLVKYALNNIIGRFERGSPGLTLQSTIEQLRRLRDEIDPTHEGPGFVQNTARIIEEGENTASMIIESGSSSTARRIIESGASRSRSRSR